MKTAFIIIISLFYAFNAHAESSKKAIDSFVDKISKKVPDGWEATYSNKNKVIEISRKNKVKGSYSLPPSLGSYNVPEKVVSLRLIISVRIKDEFTPVDYRRMHDENNSIMKNLLDIENELAKRSIHKGKGDSYDIDRISKDDSKIVKEYNTISKSLKELPEYFYETIGLDIDGNWEGATIQFIIEDSAIMDECTRVKDIVIGMAQKF